jgi:hypothetical protein
LSFFFSKLANTISVGWTDVCACKPRSVLILIRPKIDEKKNEHNPGTVDWHRRVFFLLLSMCWTEKKEEIIFLLFVFLLPLIVWQKKSERSINEVFYSSSFSKIVRFSENEMRSINNKNNKSKKNFCSFSRPSRFCFLWTQWSWLIQRDKGYESEWSNWPFSENKKKYQLNRYGSW